jgi:integrase
MSQALSVVADILTSGRETVETLSWNQLRYQHTQAVRAKLIENYNPSSANKILAALRGVLREAWRLGQINAEEYHRAADLPGVKVQTLPRGRGLSRGELRALFAACRDDETAAGRRDAAILAVGYGAGLRRQEIVKLDVSDYDAETGALVVRGGKGRKDRIGYATDGAKIAIETWLQIRGDEPGPLFIPINKGGVMMVRRMIPHAVYVIMRKRAKQAKVKVFSPHDLRRSFVSDLIDAGADIVTVQKLAGHANVTTTARYDRRGEVTKKKAAELLHVPV